MLAGTCSSSRPRTRPTSVARTAVEASGSGRSSRGGGGGGDTGGVGGSSGGSSRRPRRKARQPGLFEVEIVSPPPRSLGIHAFPANTSNGDWVEVEGSAYVVQSVILKYRLVRGRYERDHQRLEVQQTGRFLVNEFLEGLFQLEGPSR